MATNPEQACTSCSMIEPGPKISDLTHSDGGVDAILWDIRIDLSHSEMEPRSRATFRREFGELINLSVRSRSTRTADN